MMNEHLKILVVEDNPLNMKLINVILHSQGVKVLAAENAEDGIEICKTSQPDLVLMDIQLPGMDGLEATRIIKNNQHLKHIPVVALTAHAMEGDEEKAYRVGFDGYITKPIDTDTFMESVRSYLDPGLK